MIRTDSEITVESFDEAAKAVVFKLAEEPRQVVVKIGGEINPTVINSLVGVLVEAHTKRPPAVTGDTSDGYHTFNDLYAHRMALTLALVKSWPNRSWRSKQHNPGDTPIFDGFFIVGMDLPGVSQITYHYKLEHWNAFNDVRTVDYAPKWDGHRPEDVVERLNKWSENI